MGPFEVVVRGDVAGWVLTSVIPEDGPGVTGIVDRDGRWVWWRETEPGRFPMSARIAPDGRSVVYAEFEPTNQGADVGQLVWVDVPSGEVTTTRLVRGHHDFALHDDGTVAFLSLHTVDVGRDHPLGFDRVDEVPREATDDTARRGIYDTFSFSPVEPYGVCDHVERSRRKFGERVYEWTHANSLMWEPEEGAYYLNAKWTDWLVKVDRDARAPVWVMNGDGGSFTTPEGGAVWAGPEASTLWSHSHVSQVWPGGLMVFDNGLHHEHGVSALVRVAFDESARTAERVWSFAHPDGLQTPSMGDAKWLPSGNVLGSWADLSEVTEVTPEGEVVWHVRGPQGAMVGRATWLSSLEPLVAPGPPSQR